MGLVLKPLGRIVVHVERSHEFEAGPKGTRSVSDFESVTWQGDVINARSLWANGSYTTGATGISEPEIRALFRTDDGAMIFLHYWCRVDMGKLRSQSVAGPLLAGRIETNDERYAWLNETHVVGDGMYTQAVDADGAPQPSGSRMEYEMYALARS